MEARVNDDSGNVEGTGTLDLDAAADTVYVQAIPRKVQFEQAGFSPLHF